MPVAGFPPALFCRPRHRHAGQPRQLPGVRPENRFLKTTFDQIGAIILIVLLAPLMLALAIMARAEGGAGAYRHRRIGMGGREFECLKFRTMVPDADQVLRRVIASDARRAAEWRATQKLRDDPRITRIGQLLRRFSSLDELPQLFNVLRGEMSLAGSAADRAGRRWSATATASNITTPRNQVLLVCGRSADAATRRMTGEFPNSMSGHVRNWSLWHDVAILFPDRPGGVSHDAGAP